MIIPTSILIILDIRNPHPIIVYNTQLEGSAAPLKVIIKASFVLESHVLIASADEEPVSD